MEPEAHNYESSMELPQPTEAGGNTPPEQGPAPQPERRGMQMPSATTGPKQPAPVSQVSQPDPSLTPTAGSMPPAPGGSNHTASLMADDADLIEKEWVIKAKAIVMHTKDDPHEQNREMNKVKADYLKKRYNKDLKVSES